MKPTGIVRKLDELGRIVLPIELRRQMDPMEKDEIEIYVEDDRIILKKYVVSCSICGNDRGVCVFKGKYICKDCLQEMHGKKLNLAVITNEEHMTK